MTDGHRAGMVRALAFYLPQFHPTPENDEWWGKGFTEWRNVAKARPQFPGHYQPHLPADLGFYDLRLPEVREAQAALAREFGLHGFCYYHYWFNGRRILERPFNEVLASGSPDLPFCLCWANENWTRVWDGGERHVLLGQHYSAEDDLAHIQALMPAFHDPRYIRIDGKPLFLVYRTELLPDPRATAERWRAAAVAAGLPGLYLARVEQFSKRDDPRAIGFDAAVEFAPDGPQGRLKHRGALGRALSTMGLIPHVFSTSKVATYAATAEDYCRRTDPPFKRFFGVTPMWDNSARRKDNANIYTDSTPALYERWLRRVVARTLTVHGGDERIVFINAWNEWAEGCHLEPDQKWGRAYLEATQRALDAAKDVAARTAQGPELQPGEQPPAARPSRLRSQWWKFRKRLDAAGDLVKLIVWHLRRVGWPNRE